MSANISMSANAQLVAIPAIDVVLKGSLELPDRPIGLVLFAHGSGSSRLSPRNQFVARLLREAGMGTLLFDLLTRAEEAAEQYARHLRFNIELLAERLVAATNWVTREPALRLPLGFFGSSTGAAAALVAAANLGDKINAVVSRGGRPDLAGAILGHVLAATLLIVGEEDEEVLELNRLAYAHLRCEKKLTTVPGATHLFEEPGTLEMAAEMAILWFQQHLHPQTKG